MCNLLYYLRPCLPVFTGPNNTLCAVTVCRVTLEQLHSVLLQSTKTHFKSNGSYNVYTLACAHRYNYAVYY